MDWNDGRCNRVGWRTFAFTLLPVIMIAAMHAGCAARSAPIFAVSSAETQPAPVDPIELLTPEPLPVSHTQVEQWVRRAALNVTQFLGRYPVRHVVITVLPVDHGTVQDGVENGGERISIRLGRETRASDLADDWILTHEMFHLSQPDMDEDYKWMMEGMADYFEPVARAQNGQISTERFWTELVEGLPQGLPEPGDRGLDRTHTWGRIYWGGSLFWLLADVRVRQQTHNNKSVKNAARAVLEAGGDGSQDNWSIDKLLSAYDRATGTQVFTKLHDEMGTHAVTTNLVELWKSLGVQYRMGQVIFDDSAPLSAIRKAITVR
jgi:hypothetical protein